MRSSFAAASRCRFAYVQKRTTKDGSFQSVTMALESISGTKKRYLCYFKDYIPARNTMARALALPYVKRSSNGTAAAFGWNLRPGKVLHFISQYARRRQVVTKVQEDAIEVLLVEDNLADIHLTKEAFAEGSIRPNLKVVRNGVEALEYLRGDSRHAKASLPKLILLDLNLPKINGRELLAELKQDPDLKS